MTDVVVLYTTWPDGETAAAAGTAAVQAGLAACVNVMSHVRSTYRWQGRLETVEETPALFKTTGEVAPRLRDWIAARHTYETPAILAFTAGPASLGAYLDWVTAEVGRIAAEAPYAPTSFSTSAEAARPR